MIVRLLVVCVAIMCLAAVNGQTTVHGQATDQGFATFYILNDVAGILFHFNLQTYDNGQDLAIVGEKKFAIRRVAPGRHVLKVLGMYGELVIHAMAGETYFFKRATEVLLLGKRETFGRISKDEAKRRLAQMTPTDEQSATLASAPAAWIFVANMGSDQIVRIDDMRGFDWTSFGNRGSGANQFHGPAGIFVDAGGKIYVTDAGNHRVVRIDDMTGVGWTTFGTFGSGTSQFSNPQGIFVNAAGQIFVADTINNRIVRIDNMTGAGWTTFGTFGSRGDETNQFDSPRDIFVDAAGKIFVTDSNNHRVVRIDDMTGAGWTTFGSFGDGANQFLGPVGVFTDATGKIFVTDAGNGRVVRIDDMMGTGWTTFGATGGGGGQFRDPNHIFVSSGGQISLADSSNNRIVRLDNMTGAGWTTLGRVGSDGKSLKLPAGIFVR